MASLLLTLNIFHTCSSAANVNFEQENSGWLELYALLTYFMPLISLYTPWKYQKTSSENQAFSDVFRG